MCIHVCIVDAGWPYVQRNQTRLSGLAVGLDTGLESRGFKLRNTLNTFIDKISRYAKQNMLSISYRGLNAAVRSSCRAGYRIISVAALDAKTLTFRFIGRYHVTRSKHAIDNLVIPFRGAPKEVNTVKVPKTPFKVGPKRGKMRESAQKPFKSIANHFRVLIWRSKYEILIEVFV